MKLISILLSFILFTNNIFANNCDWSKIIPNSNGSYTYSKQLHLCVGQLVQKNKTQTTQITDLNKAITLQDLTIKTADQRADNWMDTSLKLEDNVQKMDSIQKTNNWIWFGIGALTVLVTGFALSAITNRH